MRNQALPDHNIDTDVARETSCIAFSAFALPVSNPSLQVVAACSLAFHVFKSKLISNSGTCLVVGASVCFVIALSTYYAMLSKVSDGWGVDVVTEDDVGWHLGWSGALSVLTACCSIAAAGYFVLKNVSRFCSR